MLEQHKNLKIGEKRHDEIWAELDNLHVKSVSRVLVESDTFWYLPLVYETDKGYFLSEFTFSVKNISKRGAYQIKIIDNGECIGTRIFDVKKVLIAIDEDFLKHTPFPFAICYRISRFLFPPYYWGNSAKWPAGYYVSENFTIEFEKV